MVYKGSTPRRGPAESAILDPASPLWLPTADAPLGASFPRSLIFRSGKGDLFRSGNLGPAKRKAVPVPRPSPDVDVPRNGTSALAVNGPVANAVR